ncbi:uncharacterized protein FIESC28_10240 [Fusarium coffeatum]|uniref:Lysr family regulatory protein n=1 Tax=Fusarium coffeatum TaxID=231269 RepID=A0A366QWT1_9HYPO|nr:uncharacterized protein FIESC28_10240 [Fusarium coffeatum]RBR08440.1 hypothetical protein FIESC28_10240 [Fusarium coffeatum]
MALQAIRRFVLGQTRQSFNYPTNPTDTILPVYYFDDTPLLRNYVQCSTLRFNDVLDAEMLKDSLSRVIALPGWRKLGGRVRMNNKGKLEIHIPRDFDSERPAVGFHHDTFNISIDEHPVASKLPKPTAEEPSIQDQHPEFTTLGVPLGTPRCLEDYLKSDHPQLTLHIVSFTDATLVSICWPHIAVDGISLGHIGHAWSLALAGRMSEIPPMLSAGDDAMATAGRDPAFTQSHPLEEQQITGWRMYLFAFYYIFDLIWWRAIESKAIFLPRAYAKQLRKSALDSLSKNQSELFVSESDAIVAWLAIVVASALFPKGSNRPLTIGNAYDLRGRAPSLFPEPGAYIQNAVFPCWATLPASTVHQRDNSTLGSIASAVRGSIRDQTTETSIHAQARLTREALELSGVPPLFGDANQFTIHFASVKADLAEALDFSPAIMGRRGSQYKNTWTSSPGHPVYYHIKCISPNNMLARNYSLISRTSSGDYWIHGNYPPQVWKTMKSMLLAVETATGPRSEYAETSV